MEVRQSLAATLLIAAGVLAAAGGWYLARATQLEAGPGASTEEVVASLQLPVVDGDVDGPALHRGDLVVLDFWASWCGPCHVQSRLLTDLRADYVDQGVKFFAVNVGESESLIRASLEENPIGFPVLMDVNGETAARAEIFGLPTLVILDRDGSIAMLREGLTSARTVRRALDELLTRETQSLAEAPLSELAVGTALHGRV